MCHCGFLFPSNTSATLPPLLLLADLSPGFAPCPFGQFAFIRIKYYFFGKVRRFPLIL